MSILELGALGEFIGAFGVIASLIYVGLGVRQNTRAARSETRLGLAQAMARNHYDAALDKDMSRIILSAISAPDSMSDEDRQRWIWWFDGFYHMLEGYFHEYQEGQLTREFMARFDSWIAGMMSLEHFQTWWESERIQNRFTDSFREYVDELIANPPDSRWQWMEPTEVFVPR